MYDVALRATKDRLLAPLVQQHFAAIHPNAISIVALGVGLASAGAVAYAEYELGLIFWLLNRLLDGLDGLVARLHHKQSDFGGYLDLLLDFVVYLAVPLTFVIAQPQPLVVGSVFALISVYLLNLLSWTVLATLLEKHARGAADRLTSIEMPGGLIEGAETILFYTLFFLLPGYVGELFALMAGLVLITASQRVVWAYHHLPR